MNREVLYLVYYLHFFCVYAAPSTTMYFMFISIFITVSVYINPWIRLHTVSFKLCNMSRSETSPMHPWNKMKNKKKKLNLLQRNSEEHWANHRSTKMHERMALTKKNSKKDPLKAFGTKLHFIYSISYYTFFRHFVRIGFVFAVAIFRHNKDIRKQHTLTQKQGLCCEIGSESIEFKIHRQYQMERNWTSNGFGFLCRSIEQKRYENCRIIHPFALISIVTSPHFIYEQQEQQKKKIHKTKAEWKKKLFENWTTSPENPLLPGSLCTQLVSGSGFKWKFYKSTKHHQQTKPSFEKW